MAKAAEEAGNIYFGYTFFPQPAKKMAIRKRTEEKDVRLQLLEDGKFFRKIDPSEFETINDFYDIDPPVDELIKSSKGTYFFQTVSEPDGISRRYPLIGKYEDKLFPNAFGKSLSSYFPIRGYLLLIPSGSDTV